MTSECRHCNGTGRAPEITASIPLPLPPFGQDVEDAVLADRLPPGGADILCGTDPMTGSDVWQLATLGNTRRGKGSTMVLPPGHMVESYRWPTIPIRFEFMPCVVAWAFGFTRESEQALGKALLNAGYARVDVRGGPSGPLRFEATTVRYNPSLPKVYKCANAHSLRGCILPGEKVLPSILVRG